MTSNTREPEATAGALGMAGLALADEDVREAMQRIPGYLDISIEDFRELYRGARAHAIGKLFSRARAGGLMLTDLRPLRPDMSIGEAARVLVSQRRKGLPVVNGRGLVVGMFTESDLLRCQAVDSCLELLLRAVDDAMTFRGSCRANQVADYMTADPVTVGPDDGFVEIVAAFQRHGGRAMPVVDDSGRLLGLLLRKQVIRAWQLDDLI